MFRQVLSLLLMIALLANQAVAFCGHVHPGHGDESSQRAHVHLHGHSHGHGHHHHGEPDPLEHVPATGNSANSVASNSPGHDNDAIFLGEPNQLLLNSGQIPAKKSHCFSYMPGTTEIRFSRATSRLRKCRLNRPAVAHALYLQTSRLLL
mgnify:CR=1 FL=1